MQTPIAEDFAAIRARLLEIQAAARFPGSLPAGVTLGEPRKRELTTEELRQVWKDTP